MGRGCHNSRSGLVRHLGAPPADLNSSASRGGSRLSVRGLAIGEVGDFAGDPGIHSDSSAGVLDGQ
jgi:hypothetical protein